MTKKTKKFFDVISFSSGVGVTQPEAGIETTATTKGGFSMPSFKVNLLDEKGSWWEEHKGGVIFFSGVGIFLCFGLFPWLVGCARIISWII